MDTVIIPGSWHKLCVGSIAALHGVHQLGAEGQSQPLEDKVEFPAETSVDPEVEDAVEEAIGGWQPHHHKLDPLWYAAARDCCGAEHTGTEEGSVARQHETAAKEWVKSSTFYGSRCGYTASW